MVGLGIRGTAPKPYQGPTQPHIQWAPGALSPGVERLGVKLITHLYLFPGFRMRRAIPPLPQYVFMALCLIKQWIRICYSNTQTLKAHSNSFP